MKRTQTSEERLLEIVELLQENPQGLLASEIAYFLGLHRSSISRSLSALDERGILLWEDGNKRIGIFHERNPEQKPSVGYDEPIRKLKALLDAKDNEEANYQKLFQEYPGILGTYYEEVVRHQRLDDENIPDFIGVRVHDKFMDIFEIKPPFMPVFRNNGEFSTNFNDSWNQAERYLAFAQIEGDYLRRKGLNFENPKCVLIAGFDVPEEGMRKLRTKQRLNPAIQMFTYNDILSLAEATVRLIKKSSKHE